MNSCCRDAVDTVVRDVLFKEQVGRNATDKEASKFQRQQMRTVADAILNLFIVSGNVEVSNTTNGDVSRCIVRDLWCDAREI